MRKTDECITTRSTITQLATLENNIVAISTKEHFIKLFSSINCKNITTLTTKLLNDNTTTICFSKDAKLIAFNDKNKIYIIHMPTQQLLKKIDTDGETITIMEFDPSSNYIIAGSTNGRVLQYKYDNSSLLARLCSFPYTGVNGYSKIRNNYVSSFAFYKNQMACSGYGGAIFILDLLSQANKNIITHANTRINALCFLDETTLISGNVDGYIDIISLKQIHKYKRLNAPFRDIKQILLMPNPMFIMVTSPKHIAIFNIKEYKLIDANYIKLNATINKVAINNEILFINFDDNKIIKIQLTNTQKLNSLILHNSLDIAFNLISQEPMLKGSKEHLELEKRYKTIYLKAVDALLHENKELAKQLTEMFTHTKEKKGEINSLFIAFKNYEQFQMHFKEKKLTLAYAMAVKYPALQYTPQYKAMEKEWKKTFKAAQKQILLGNEAKAKEYLKPYITIISKRQNIQLILKQNKEFVEFLKAIDKKEYQKIYTLAQKHEIFTQIPTYHTLMQEAQTHLQKATENLKKGKIEEVLKHIYIIKDIDSFKDEIQTIKEECKEVELLQKAYQENNFKLCYELIDIHKHLSYTELGLLLEKHWFKMIHRCEEYATKGDIKSIKETLNELILLSSRRTKIGDLLRITFQTKIKLLISKKETKQAENIIYSYIDTFGLDKEIHSIMKAYEKRFRTKLAITYNENGTISRNSWINSPLITGHLKKHP